MWMRIEKNTILNLNLAQKIYLNEHRSNKPTRDIIGYEIMAKMTDGCFIALHHYKADEHDKAADAMDKILLNVDDQNCWNFTKSGNLELYTDGSTNSVGFEDIVIKPAINNAANFVGE